MKSKLVKRGLALILTVAMTLTSNAFSTDLMLVKAAEVDGIAEGNADEVKSPVSVDDENAVVGETEDGSTVTDGSNNNEGNANTEGGNTDTDDGNSDAEGGNADSGNGNTDTNDGNADIGNGSSDTENGDSDADDENTDINDGNTEGEEGGAGEGETGEGEADESLEVSVPSYDNAETQTYYRGVAFGSKTEFEKIRDNSDYLWGNADNGITSDYTDDKWKDAATIEALLQELAADGNPATVQYAYIEQTNPNITNKTITIPSSITGVIIGDGYYDADGEGGEEGNHFGVIADTLNIEGTNTAVYFKYTAISNTGDTPRTGTFTINFPQGDNTSKVSFEDSGAPVVKCKSTNGTIVFENANFLSGYESSVPTEFHGDALLLIDKASSGFVFDRIGGDADVMFVYNGYPVDSDFLPRFNKEIDLGTGTNENAEEGEDPEYPRGISIRFLKHSDDPFEDTPNPEDPEEPLSWWDTSEDESLNIGTQIAYFAGDTWSEKANIGCRVNYYRNYGEDESSEDNYLFMNPSTGRLESDGNWEESAYRVLVLDETEFNDVKADTGLLWGTGDGDEGDNGNGEDGEDIDGSDLYAVNEGNDGNDGNGEENTGYKDRWENMDTLGGFLGRTGTEYVVIQARKGSLDNDETTLEFPENILGALLVTDWYLDPNAEVAEGEEEPEVRVPWRINSLTTKAATEVVLDGLTIDPTIDQVGQDSTGQETKELNITTVEGAKVTFRDSEVQGVVKSTSTAGTIAFEEDNRLNGYESNSLTEFPEVTFIDEETGEEAERDAKLLIAEASSGLVFNEIKGVTEVTIVYNGYPVDPENSESLELLPHFEDKIDLGRVPNVPPNEWEGAWHYRNIGIRFLEKRDTPFENIEDPENPDRTVGWWDTPDEPLDKGTQIAFLAGDTWNERASIGCRVNYNVNKENDLHMNSSTGKLEKDEEPEEQSAYRVLVLTETEFNEVKVDTGLLGEGYDDRWDGVDVDELGPFLSRQDNKYVVIQATKSSLDNDETTLEFPGNILGALLVTDWYPDPNAEVAEGEGEPENVRVPWQINSLTTKAATEVVIDGLTIEPTVDQAGQDSTDQETKELNITTVEDAEVTFRDSEVQGVVKSTSTAGAIAFEMDNRLNGYESSSLTRFPKVIVKDENGKDVERDAKLLIVNASAGLVFDRIEGAADVNIVYNGYPVDPENPDSFGLLPHFNKEINLGKGKVDEPAEGEDDEYDRGITIRFWEYADEPFGMDGTEEWWESVSAEGLWKGAQIAYFAGETPEERESIGHNVYYHTHNEDFQKFYLDSVTGMLTSDDAYRVLVFDDETQFNQAKEDLDILWNEVPGEKWEEILTLDNLYERDSIDYVAIQAMQKSYDIEDKTLELPDKIKGALLVSDWDDEANEGNGARVPWQLNSLSTSGAIEVVIADLTIDPVVDPESQETKVLNVTAETATADITFINPEIWGDVNISENATVKFINPDISGSINSLSDIEIEGEVRASGLTGCPKLTVNGGASFIVREPEALIFEDIEIIKAGNNDPYFDIDYIEGYPDDTDKLPVFNGSVKFPAGNTDLDIGIRFIKDFWTADDEDGESSEDGEDGENNDWWHKSKDETLEAGALVARFGMNKEDAKNLKVCYNMQYADYDPNLNTYSEIIADGDDKSKLVIMQKTADNKIIVNFDLSIAKEKTYDGTAFAIKDSEIFNNCGYTGTISIDGWKSKDGAALENAPKDAGEYVVTVSVPEGTADFVGSTPIPITISPKPVTVSVKPAATETPKDHVRYDIVWDGLVSGESYDTQATVDESDEQEDSEGRYYTLVTKGGDAGKNYEIHHADPVRITITGAETPDNTKPCINSVLFPKKKDTFSAVYTGEQIRPVMVVAYKYKDEKGRDKTQSLKLNVDYTLTYSDNVNVTSDTSPAKVTVKGIGEYAGEITREFSITPKSIKKVTLSAVGDIVYSEDGEDPTVVVMDGNYELVKNKDYTIVLSTKGSATADTVSELTVAGIGNYNETSKKKAKFNILKSGTEIKSIAADTVKVEFKKLPAKGYTYNGKAQKPAVVVKDGDTKVPSSQYKVIYTNNINAGNTATVQVVGVSKRGKGYYGIAKQQLTFEINQKDFSKVSVSSVAAIPKTGKLDTITITVKDGKRILTEDVDYTVDYSKIVEADGSIKSSLAIGQKCEVILKPVEGGNYTKDSQKTVYVKFGQLNLASKTANVSVKITDATQSEVEVKYNGQTLTKGQDYTATVKQDKKKPTYTVTLKAVKGSSYKGKRTIKGLSVETTPPTE